MRRKWAKVIALFIIFTTVSAGIILFIDACRDQRKENQKLRERIARLEHVLAPPESAPDEPKDTHGSRRQYNPGLNEGDVGNGEVRSGGKVVACRWGYFPVNGRCVDMHDITYYFGAVSRMETIEADPNDIWEDSAVCKRYECPAGQVWKLNSDNCVEKPDFSNRDIHCEDHFDPWNYPYPATSCEDWNTENCLYFMPDSWEAKVPGQDVAECIPLVPGCPQRFPTAVSCCTADPDVPTRQCTGGFRFIINVKQ